jgi:hypothetical protein
MGALEEYWVKVYAVATVLKPVCGAGTGKTAGFRPLYKAKAGINRAGLAIYRFETKTPPR